MPATNAAQELLPFSPPTVTLFASPESLFLKIVLRPRLGKSNVHGNRHHLGRQKASQTHWRHVRCSLHRSRSWIFCRTSSFSGISPFDKTPLDFCGVCHFHLDWLHFLFNSLPTFIFLAIFAPISLIHGSIAVSPARAFLDRLGLLWECYMHLHRQASAMTNFDNFFYGFNVYLQNEEVNIFKMQAIEKV